MNGAYKHSRYGGKKRLKSSRVTSNVKVSPHEADARLAGRTDYTVRRVTQLDQKLVVLKNLSLLTMIYLERTAGLGLPYTCFIDVAQTWLVGVGLYVV